MNKGNERIGLKNTNKQGYEMEIIDYKDNKHITVLFPQFNYTKITSYSYFKNGTTVVPNKVLYVGKIFTTNFGTDFTVIDYINDSYVLIKFNDEYGFEKVVELGNIKKGSIRNPYDKTVFGIGCTGYDDDIKYKEIYSIWHSIMQRCFSDDFKNKNRHYKDVTCYSEWLIYKNFEKWYLDNYYKIENEQMQIDKDILIKGNKIYSPQTCIIVPKNINVLFTNRRIERNGKILGFCQRGDKYETYCNEFGKRKFLGTFNSKEEAFYAYKKEKEKYIKQVADLYKGKIPQKLYEAMYNYEVEITD